MKDLFSFNVLVCVCVLLDYVVSVWGTGVLYDPPNRGVMWKYGFSTARNYDYMNLNCGGEKQHERLPASCGICGDPDQGPRRHEDGGIYGKRVISRWFPGGIKEMLVKVELLSFEKGFFEFRICAANSGPVTQECLDKNILPIKEGYLAGTPMRLYPEGAGDFHLTVAIPPDLVCDRCVLQWRYHTGNSWGTDPTTGKQGYGQGIQEEFFNCADVRIGGKVPNSVKGNVFFSPDDLNRTITNVSKPTQRKKEMAALQTSDVSVHVAGEANAAGSANIRIPGEGVLHSVIKEHSIRNTIDNAVIGPEHIFDKPTTLTGVLKSRIDIKSTKGNYHRIDITDIVKATSLSNKPMVGETRGGLVDNVVNVVKSKPNALGVHGLVNIRGTNRHVMFGGKTGATVDKGVRHSQQIVKPGIGQASDSIIIRPGGDFNPFKDMSFPGAISLTNTVTPVVTNAVVMVGIGKAIPERTNVLSSTNKLNKLSVKTGPIIGGGMVKLSDKFITSETTGTNVKITRTRVNQASKIALPKNTASKFVSVSMPKFPILKSLPGFSSSSGIVSTPEQKHNKDKRPVPETKGLGLPGAKAKKIKPATREQNNMRDKLTTSETTGTNVKITRKGVNQASEIALPKNTASKFGSFSMPKFPILRSLPGFSSSSGIINTPEQKQNKDKRPIPETKGLGLPGAKAKKIKPATREQNNIRSVDEAVPNFDILTNIPEQKTADSSLPAIGATSKISKTELSQPMITTINERILMGTVKSAFADISFPDITIPTFPAVPPILKSETITTNVLRGLSDPDVSVLNSELSQLSGALGITGSTDKSTGDATKDVAVMKPVSVEPKLHTLEKRKPVVPDKGLGLPGVMVPKRLFVKPAASVSVERIVAPPLMLVSSINTGVDSAVVDGTAVATSDSRDIPGPGVVYVDKSTTGGDFATSGSVDVTLMDNTVENMLRNRDTTLHQDIAIFPSRGASGIVHGTGAGVSKVDTKPPVDIIVDPLTHLVATIQDTGLGDFKLVGDSRHIGRSVGEHTSNITPDMGFVITETPTTLLGAVASAGAEVSSGGIDVAASGDSTVDMVTLDQSGPGPTITLGSGTVAARPPSDVDIVNELTGFDFGSIPSASPIDPATDQAGTDVTVRGMSDIGPGGSFPPDILPTGGRFTMLTDPRTGFREAIPANSVGARTLETRATAMGVGATAGGMVFPTSMTPGIMTGPASGHLTIDLRREEERRARMAMMNSRRMTGGTMGTMRSGVGVVAPGTGVAGMDMAGSLTGGRRGTVGVVSSDSIGSVSAAGGGGGPFGNIRVFANRASPGTGAFGPGLTIVGGGRPRGVTFLGNGGGGMRATGSEGMRRALGTMGTRMGGAMGGVGTRMGGAMGGVGTRMGGAMGGVATRMSGTMGGVGTRMSGGMGGVGTRMRGAMGGVGTRMSGAMGGVGTRMSGGIGGVGTRMSGARGFAGGIGSTRAGFIGTGAPNATLAGPRFSGRTFMPGGRGFFPAGMIPGMVPGFGPVLDPFGRPVFPYSPSVMGPFPGSSPFIPGVGPVPFGPSMLPRGFIRSPFMPGPTMFGGRI